MRIRSPSSKVVISSSSPSPVQFLCCKTHHGASHVSFIRPLSVRSCRAPSTAARRGATTLAPRHSAPKTSPSWPRCGPGVGACGRVRWARAPRVFGRCPKQQVLRRPKIPHRCRGWIRKKQFIIANLGTRPTLRSPPASRLKGDGT